MSSPLPPPLLPIPIPLPTVTAITTKQIVDQLSSELTCGICLEVVNISEPVVTQCCRRLYCRTCIQQWLTGNTGGGSGNGSGNARRQQPSSRCPLDRLPLTVQQLLRPPLAITNMLTVLNNYRKQQLIQQTIIDCPQMFAAIHISQVVDNMDNMTKQSLKCCANKSHLLVNGSKEATCCGSRICYSCWSLADTGSNCPSCKATSNGWRDIHPGLLAIAEKLRIRCANYTDDNNSTCNQVIKVKDLAKHFTDVCPPALQQQQQRPDYVCRECSAKITGNTLVGSTANVGHSCLKLLNAKVGQLFAYQIRLTDGVNTVANNINKLVEILNNIPELGSHIRGMDEIVLSENLVVTTDDDDDGADDSTNGGTTASGQSFDTTSVTTFN
ncbi:uncharacterized protein LOC128955453 [Oppia nitens]|uniref:uncharacterized protein LOC128955453 n=1 Tax=Oppia nitens TaxID=1686743 RepID=UPI0023DC8B7D|nr:uncharacterized protein LOC128955453 [Oppia nitens]